MYLKFINLQESIEDHWYGMRLDWPPSEAFPKLNDPGLNGGFTVPLHALLRGIRWSWLKWHEQTDVLTIQPALKLLVKRGLELYQMPNCPKQQENHDSFLIHAAILCGDSLLMRKAAETVIPANGESSAERYVKAWTGVLKYRMLNEPEQELRQFRLFASCKPRKNFAWPNTKLVEGFVFRDQASFQKAYTAGIQRYSRLAEKLGVFSGGGEPQFNFDTKKMDLNMFWPWVEAVFARLLIREGFEIRTDSFWVPDGLLALD